VVGGFENPEKKRLMAVKDLVEEGVFRGGNKTII